MNDKALNVLHLYPNICIDNYSILILLNCSYIWIKNQA